MDGFEGWRYKSTIDAPQQQVELSLWKVFTETYILEKASVILSFTKSRGPEEPSIEQKSWK